MVKPLIFKGEKKPRKRKHNEVSESSATNASSNTTHDEDDSWTVPGNASELNGPTMIVLSTQSPTCLASDANGNVFASPIENMIEGDAKTAEPHTVQQVWVASRVAGMAENEVSFKATHGGYLSCDQYGILSAKREARGREENFSIEETTDDSGRIHFQLQTAATVGKAVEKRRFLNATAKEIKVDSNSEPADKAVKKISVALRGDGEASQSETKVILRMQTRFKPQTAEAKETARVSEKIGRKELEGLAGRTLTDEETRKLKRAKREGNLGEALLDIRAKGKHDKYA